MRLALTGILLPEHFGWVAMISILVGLLGLVVDLGLRQVLIQRPRDASTRLVHDSAFWLTFAAGPAWVAGMAGLGAPLLVALYGQQAVLAPSMAMALGLLPTAWSLYPTVMLTRRMRFRSLVTAEAAGAVSGAAAAIALAYAGAGVWSLVGQSLVSGYVTCAALWRECRSVPRWRFDFRSLRPLWRNGTAILGVRAVQYLRANVDRLIVGITLGASALGIYSLAHMVVEGVRLQVAAVIDRVMLPAFSRLQDDRSSMGTQYLAAVRAWTTTLLPAFLAAALFAPNVVEACLDPAWWPAAEPLRILALCGVVYAISGPCSEVLQAVGRPGTLLRITWLNLVLVALPGIWWMSTRHGVSGAASAFTLAFAFQRMAIAWAAIRCIGTLGLRNLMGAIAPACLLCAALATGYMILGSTASPYLHAFVFAVAFLALHIRVRRMASH